MEYTILASAGAALAVLADRLLGTHLLRTGPYRIFLALMGVFTIVSNSYLTGRPIVLYGEQFHLGIRLGTIPMEDFLFGFALVTMSVILWEYYKRRGERS